MSDLSSRVSLREIVGAVAPGLMVIASFIYVAARIPTLVLREEERPQRPARIEIVPEGQFVFQHPDVSGQWML